MLREEARRRLERKKNNTASGETAVEASCTPQPLLAPASLRLMLCMAARTSILALARRTLPRPTPSRQRGTVPYAGRRLSPLALSPLETLSPSLPFTLTFHYSPLHCPLLPPSSALAMCLAHLPAWFAFSTANTAHSPIRPSTA